MKNNNKRFSILLTTGFLLTIAMVFYFSYPLMKRQAESVAENPMGYENLVERLLQQNYVFYRDYREFIDQEKISFGDLYLTVKKQLILQEKNETQPPSAEDMESSDVDEDLESFDDYFIYQDDIVSMTRTRQESIEQIISNWSEQNKSFILTQLDYYVTGPSEGYQNRNTKKQLELLLEDEKAFQEQEGLQYQFYFRFTYDTSGRLSQIQIGGEDADELLKIVKSKEQEPLLPQDESYTIFDTDGKFYSVSLISESPKDITVIYGVTYEQWNTMLNPVSDDDYTMWKRMHEYSSGGVRGIIYICFFIVMAAAFLLPQLKQYQMHKFLVFQKIPVEVTVLAGFFLLSLGTDGILRLMIWTNEGYMQSFLGEYLYVGMVNVLPFVVAVINIAVLFVIFGVWYSIITILRPIKKQGLREYLSQRCLSLSLASRLSARLKKFWKELVNCDLSRRMETILVRLVLINLVIVYLTANLFQGFGLTIYSVVLFLFLRKWLNSVKEQYENLLYTAGKLANGDLNTQIPVDTGIFEEVFDSLDQIQEGLKTAVEEEVKSQRMKTELITNVSHDLKTPLTAIITYIDLLKQEGLTAAEQADYLKTLEQKSQRLKVLIEDLFEISKATSNNVTLNIMDVDIISLMKQVWFELSDRVEQSGLEFRFDLTEEKIILPLDSQKTYRIFENLYVNILKYALPGTRVYVSAKCKDDFLKIDLKNISAAELTVNPSELAERFVRGDSSRNTEGSGLGLAIAKSFTELQNGRMEIETDGDLFKVTLWWPLMQQELLEEQLLLQNTK